MQARSRHRTTFVLTGRNRGGLICATMASVALAQPMAAQDAGARLLDSVVTANSRVVRLENGRLAGDGGAFLLAEAARSQFVVLGEQHNTTEIPQITTALFRSLQASAGYQYLADEQDPLTLQLISRGRARGNRDSVLAIARRYPHAYTFVSDQELTMLAEIGAASKGRGDPLWGCDQAFGATHVLDQLLLQLTNPRARDLAAGLRDASRARESVRNLEKYHYMATEPKSDALAQLAQVANAAPGSANDFLLQSLIVSDRVYRNYREGHGYENGYEREEYMKRRFLDEYRHAAALDRRTPRVILKFGHWHAFRGVGPSNLQTLGDFVSQFAVANDSRSFHIAIFPNGDPGEYGDISQWTPRTPKLLAAAATPAEWMIVDLRPLRAVYGRVIATMSAEEQDSFRRWVFGFDAALFVGRMRRATYALNPGVAY